MRSITLALLLAAAPAIAAPSADALIVAQQSMDDADAWLDIVRDRVAALKAERKVATQSERTAEQLLQTALVTGHDIEAATERLQRASTRTARIDTDLAGALSERTWAEAQLTAARLATRDARKAQRDA